MLNLNDVGLPVCLATRTADGRVTLQAVEDIRIDDDEFHFRVIGLSAIARSSEGSWDAGRMQHWFESQESEYGDAAWFGVVHSADIDPSGTIQLNLPIVATFWPGWRNELWLLLGPIEDWPKEWGLV